MKTIEIKSFGRGIDMLSAETKVPLRKADNIDLDRDGRPMRRKGLTTVLAGSGYHSGWHSKRGIPLVAKGSELFMFNDLTYAVTSIFALNSEHQVSYCEHNGDIFFSNRTTIGFIPFPGTAARALGVPTPLKPQAATSAAGSLAVGKYAVAVSWVDDRGEESGLSDLTAVELTSVGEITVSWATPPAGYTTRVYSTTCDGDVPRLIGEYSHVIGSVSISSEPVYGVPADSAELDPMPCGQYVRAFNGRVYVAKKDTLYFSEPFRYGLCSRRHGFVRFDTEITMLGNNTNGLFVGDSRGVWFLAGGDPTKFQMQLATTERAIHGTCVHIPAHRFPSEVVNATEDVPVWLSRAGHFVGAPGGQAIPLNEKRIRLPSVTLNMKGYSAYVEREGLKQLLTPVNFTSAAPGTAVDTLLT